MPSETLKLRDIRVTRGAKTILDGVDLEFERGKLVVIRGHNASGKTRLLHVAAGLEPADGGEVFWGDQALSSLAAHQIDRLRPRYVGIAFQEHKLLSLLSGEENIRLPSLVAPVTDEARAKGEQIVNELRSKWFEDEHDLRKRVADLNGGAKSLVEILRAFRLAPSFVLADETLAFLDPNKKRLVFGNMTSVCREYDIGVVLVSNETEAYSRVDTEYALTEGRLEV